MVQQTRVPRYTHRNNKDDVMALHGITKNRKYGYAVNYQHRTPVGYKKSQNMKDLYTVGNIFQNGYMSYMTGGAITDEILDDIKQEISSEGFDDLNNNVQDEYNVKRENFTMGLSPKVITTVLVTLALLALIVIWVIIEVYWK